MLSISLLMFEVSDESINFFANFVVNWLTFRHPLDRSLCSAGACHINHAHHGRGPKDDLVDRSATWKWITSKRTASYNHNIDDPILQLTQKFTEIDLRSSYYLPGLVPATMLPRSYSRILMLRLVHHVHQPTYKRAPNCTLRQSSTESNSLRFCGQNLNILQYYSNIETQ